MMRELKLRRTGALSNAGRIEALMRHMQYGDEKIQEVLATLTTRSKPQNDDWLEEAGLDQKSLWGGAPLPPFGGEGG